MTTFFCPGIPVPKGSAKSFYNKKAGKIVTMQDNRDRQKPWASLISYTAQEAGCHQNGGPVSITMVFSFPRPKSHFGTGRNAQNIKESAPISHTVKPDLDKLARCVLDALTGVAFGDDSQVREIITSKTYSDQPGVLVSINGG